MEVDMEQLRKTALEVITKVVKEGKLEENTQKVIRRKVEDAMGLEEGALDGKEHKDVVKDVVQEYIANYEEGGTGEKVQDPPKKGKGQKAKSSDTTEPKAAKSRTSRSTAPKPKVERAAPKKADKGKKPARSASVVPTSDEEAEAKPAPPKSKPPRKRTTKAKRVDSDDEASDADDSPEPPAKRQKTTTPSKDEDSGPPPSSSSVAPAPTAEDESQPEAAEKGVDGDKSESEMSVLIDDDPPVRKRKKKADSGAGSSSRGEKGTKGRKRKEPAKELSKDEETIKRLKSLVVACGIRKVWSKEFKNLDKPSDQIRRLRQILADLGMSGRMSMEQAKAIKEKREFEKELEDVQEFAQKMESAGRRRSQKSTVAEEVPLDDSDVEAAPKRRPTARQSIMAFLGDEEESE